MKRILVAAATGLVLATAPAAVASAGMPPGLRGYEGQPGHQAGAHPSGHHGAHAPGLRGYEGQPGHQGG